MSLVDDDLGEDPGPSTGWQPRPWWAWFGVLLTGGVLALAWGGVRLASSDLGTSLRPRSCDGGVIAALALLGIGALLVLASMTVARLQHPGALLTWDASTLALTLPIPMLLLGGALPGVAGCRAARSLDELPLLGSALVGASGIALAGIAVALVAAALAGVASVSWLAPAGVQDEEPPGIVELAIAEAEALEAEGASERFRGVDPA